MNRKIYIRDSQVNRINPFLGWVAIRWTKNFNESGGTSDQGLILSIGVGAARQGLILSIGVGAAHWPIRNKNDRAVSAHAN